MGYEGRSPLKDVTRSVVIGAAMVSPALLAQCAPPTPTTTPETNGTGSGGVTQAGLTPTDDAGATEPQAPPQNVVRPRAPVGSGTSMPTRGFSGGARVVRG